MKRSPLLLACLVFGCAVGGGRDPDSGDVPPDGGSSDAAACEAPSMWCGSICADPRRDRRHCGGCDEPCSGECMSGVCMDSDCRTSELGCPDGTSCDPADGMCVTVECDPGLVACGTECCAPPLFDAPEDLAISGSSISLALDTEQRPSVAYVSAGAAPMNLILRRRVSGSWQDSTITSSSDPIDASMVLDGNDRALVAWTVGGTDGFSYSVDGGAPEQFGAGPILNLALRTPPSGRASVGYGSGDTGEVRLAERAAIWVSEAVAERAQASSHGAAFAFGPDSAPHFAFMREGSTVEGTVYDDVRYARRGTGGSWSDEVVDDSGTRGAATTLDPMIAVTPSGIPHVLYWTEDAMTSAVGQLWHAVRTGPDAWARELVASSTGPNRDVSIRAAGDGAVHIAYFDGSRLFHAISRGRGFARTPIATLTAIHELALALDADGAPYVLYADGLDAIHLAGPP